MQELTQSNKIKNNIDKNKGRSVKMENFIYSINATIPVFFIIIIGYALKRIGMLDEHFANVANKFNFTITLPLLLFQDIATTDIAAEFDLKYVLFCMLVTSISFWSIWAGAKLWMKDKSIRGAFVQASFRGSAAVLGIAFIMNIYGDSGMAPLMIVGAVPLYNIYSVIVLTFEAGNKEGSNIKNAIINIVKNPIILAILAGVIGSLLHVYDYAPFLIKKTINNFAVLASPLALITIGVGFEGKKALAKMKPTLVASFLKLILQPALFLPIAVMLGFREQKMIALLVMLGAPTTASCYIMAKNMDNDGVLTSSIVVVTTLLSSITLTVWIYILKCKGLL